MSDSYTVQVEPMESILCQIECQVLVQRGFTVVLPKRAMIVDKKEGNLTLLNQIFQSHTSIFGETSDESIRTQAHVLNDIPCVSIGRTNLKYQVGPVSPSLQYYTYL